VRKYNPFAAELWLFDLFIEETIESNEVQMKLRFGWI